MKESKYNLVWGADLSAISLYRSILNKFPVVGNIDLKRWDFYITIANVWVAVTALDNTDYSETKKQELQKIVIKDLIEKYPDGVRALNDCTDLINRTLSGNEGISQGDALGCWIVWNLFNRTDLSEEERQIIRVLGDISIESFRSWWK
jgi:hypothetical protein